MAIQQQKRPAPSQKRPTATSNQGPTIFWAIVVVGLILAIGYFGFIDVGK